MEQTTTINIEKLIDKLEITNSGCVNLPNLETSIQEALLKAVNSAAASFKYVKTSDTTKEVNSAKSRLSEERAYRENSTHDTNLAQPDAKIHEGCKKRIVYQGKFLCPGGAHRF
jgi:hypothetical protein